MKKKPMHGTGAAKRHDLPDDLEQSKRFEEKAREIGDDESREKFEDVFEAVATKRGGFRSRPSVKRP